MAAIAAPAVLAALACGPAAPTIDLPDRPPDAPGGTEIVEQVRDLSLEAREERIYAEVARGNVPDWLRVLRRVDMAPEVDGREHEVTFWVAPDYVVVGSDADFFRFPLSPQTGQRIADLVGASMPTPRMVDAIWRSAEIHLSPIRMRPDMDMITVPVFEHHERLVRGQRMAYGAEAGVFLAGHRKDVVLVPALDTLRGRVAIYGWHRQDGRPVQPVYAGHSNRWVDYSHGVRLVHRAIVIDGVLRDLLEVLRDPALAPIVSEDGVIAEPRYSPELGPPADAAPDSLGDSGP